jgi:hypothetical protein
MPNSDSSFNKWADFWRYECGLNVIPADTKNKRVYEKWSQWQDKGIDEEQYHEWKERNAFDNGIAIMVGKVWHRPDLADYHLCFIDLDNQKAIDEICTIFGAKDIKELSQTTIVEQHPDSDSKAHVYFYTKYVLKKKSSDTTRKLKDKLDSNELPAIEVKCQSDGLAYCTPSPHKNGHNYEIIGTEKIGLFEGEAIENMLFEVYKKYGLLINEDEKNRYGNYKIPIEELFKPGFKINEGHNRSEAVMRVAESLYARFGSTKTLEMIRQETYDWMIVHCNPPLDMDKFERQFNDGIKFVNKTTTQDQKNILQQQLKIKNEENTIFKIVDYSIPYKAYYIDEKLGQICYGKVTDDGIFPLKSIINIVPKKILFYKNPLFLELEPKVELIFYDNGKKEVKTIGPYNSLTELLRDLQNKGYVLNKARAEDAFNSIKNAMEEKGNNVVEYITDVTTVGYYLIDGKMVMKNVSQSNEEISKEDTVECCSLLDTLTTGWRNKDIFPTVLKWGLISPFMFIIKSNTEELIPWLQMFGWGKSGKTTLGLLVYMIWNRSTKVKKGFSNIDTIPRLGKTISKDTYPVLVNEVGSLYETGRFSKYKSIRETIKHGVESTTVRGTFTDYKRYEDIPALSPLILTSNFAPNNDGGFGRRFISIHFPKDEKKEPEEENKFKKILQDKKGYLKVLGDFAMQYISKDPSILLKEDWKDIAKRILIKFYQFAGKEAPEWVEYFIEQKDAVDESNEKTMFALRAFIVNRVNTAYLKTGDSKYFTLEDKLRICLSYNLISFLHVKRERNGNEIVIITHDIIDEIKNSLTGIENITSLNDIGLQIGFVYGDKYVNGKKARVLFGIQESLLKFIDPDIGDE